MEFNIIIGKIYGAEVVERMTDPAPAGHKRLRKRELNLFNNIYRLVLLFLSLCLLYQRSDIIS